MIRAQMIIIINISKKTGKTTIFCQKKAEIRDNNNYLIIIEIRTIYILFFTKYHFIFLNKKLIFFSFSRNKHLLSILSTKDLKFKCFFFLIH